MIGRIIIDGEDVGVRADYQLGAVITQSIVDTVKQKIHHQGKYVAWEIGGKIPLEQETKVSVSVENLPKGSQQEIRVDGQLVPIDPLDQGAELTLASGTPTITWTVRANRFDRAYLRLHDADTGRPLDVDYDTNKDSRPTELTISVHRTDP
jgi:hypothetical protein